MAFIGDHCSAYLPLGWSTREVPNKGVDLLMSRTGDFEDRADYPASECILTYMFCRGFFPIIFNIAFFSIGLG